MYMLQLFDAADEVQPIDARLIRDGLIRIGRDKAADWSIVDPERELSRSHCELAVVADQLHLRALGSNGVFDEATGTRFPDEVDVPVSIPSTICFGRFRLKASRAVQDGEMSDTATATSASEVSAAAPRSGKSLLEAFCEGAGLDASLLSSEDPADIMRRAGAVYRQMVIGTAELMADRERARAERDISRTTISGVDNNPFKWAPTQRLAIDLLLAGTGNFLSGPAALQVSFAEIRRHLLASAAGFQASLQAAVATFDPENLDAAIVERASLLKSRAALEMEEVSRRHADLTAQLQGERRGLLERAFVSAYDTAEVEARSRPR